MSLILGLCNFFLMFFIVLNGIPELSQPCTTSIHGMEQIWVFRNSLSVSIRW